VHGSTNINKQKIRSTLNFVSVQVLRHEDEWSKWLQSIT